jgi:hypothetical protein
MGRTQPGYFYRLLAIGELVGDKRAVGGTGPPSGCRGDERLPESGEGAAVDGSYEGCQSLLQHPTLSVTLSRARASAPGPGSRCTRRCPERALLACILPFSLALNRSPPCGRCRVAASTVLRWHAETRAEGCIDRTVYGTSRTATTSFFTHHLRLILLAAVIGAALPVAIWAKARKSHLLSGAPLAGLLPV